MNINTNVHQPPVLRKSHNDLTTDAKSSGISTAELRNQIYIGLIYFAYLFRIYISYLSDKIRPDSGETVVLESPNLLIQYKLKLL